MQNSQADVTTNPLLMKTYIQEKLDAVSLYVQKGWYVIPLDHIHGKKPINNGGRNNPYKFPEDAEKGWAVKHPLANIGIVTGTESGLYVIDIDGKGDDYEIFKRCLPETLKSRTSKGMHYYYRRPDGHTGKLGNKVRNLIPGMDIDVRSDGGYVVAPPSINPITQYRYQFDNPDAEAVDIPNWLLDLHERGETKNAPRGIQELYAKYDKELSKEQVKIEERRNGNQIDLKSMQKITDKIILAKIDEALNAKVGERNKRLNDAVFTMAGLIHTGTISETEVIDIGYEIANGNGLLADDGQRSILAVIRSGIASGLSKRLIVTMTNKELTKRKVMEATQVLQSNMHSEDSAISKIKNGEVKLTAGSTMLNEMIDLITDMDLLYLDVSSTHSMVGRVPPWYTPHQDPSKYPRTVSNVEDIEMRAWAEKTLGIKISKGNATDIIDAAVNRKQRDLLKEYVEDCGRKWDGVPRIRNWVSTYLGVIPTDIAHEFGFRWLLQMANRALNPGCKADSVLVVEGSQGIGKSTALRNLVPDRKYFLDGLKDFEQNPKDAQQECLRAWLIEIAENFMFSRKNPDSLKQFIGRQDETFRAPYGRYAEQLPRRAVFAITTNNSSYLFDTTGNRRFLPVLAENTIDTLGIERDRDQFWGEAVHLLGCGEPTFISLQFQLQHEQETNARLYVDPWEYEVQCYLDKTVRPVTINDAFGFLCVPVERQSKRDQNRIADILRKLGYETANLRLDGKQTRIWRKKAISYKIPKELAEQIVAEKEKQKTEQVITPLVIDDDDYGF